MTASRASGPEDFLCEIWVEELPVRYIMPAVRQLEALCSRLCGERGIMHEGMTTYATQNRLALVVRGMAAVTRHETRTVVGPPRKALYDSQGQLTAAANGFARKYGIAPEQITCENDRAVVRVTIGGEKTAEVLAAALPGIIGSINFPKSMVWEESRFSFARPIRNLVVLFGARVLPVAVAGVKAANKTRGLAGHANRLITIRTARAYAAVLKNHCVLVDPAERKAVIQKLAQQLLAPLGAALVPGETLVDDVCFMVEHPVAIVGSFNKEFLDLPEVALISCLRDTQKFFPVVDARGTLVPYFLGFRNGISQNQAVVREGYCRVVEARLRDIQFFVRKDRQTTLEHKVPSLRRLTQAEELGSVYEKAQRLVSLSSRIAGLLACPPEEEALIGRAALLAKADLVTEMVFEYPELQGTMGGIYAGMDGEDSRVAAAITEQYLPTRLGGPLPQTRLGAILAVADKIDSLCSSFVLGYVPRGSGDPFGLRRMALGMVNIIFAFRFDLPLAVLIDEAFGRLPESLRQKHTQATEALLAFVRQRLAVYFREKGYAHDLVEAVLSYKWLDLLGAQARLDAFGAVRVDERFESFILLFRRADNIIAQARQKGCAFDSAPRPEKFTTPEERRLWEVCSMLDADYVGLVQERAFQQLFFRLVEFQIMLHAFFDTVLVMDPDEQVRTNRLSLINHFLQYFFILADCSKIVLPGDEKQ